MKKKLMSLLAITLLAYNVNAQSIKEPEFAGETILVKADNSVTRLEKHLAQSRRVASTGLLLTGIGKYREQIQIEGCCANIKFSKNDDVYFIIRNVDNATDPLAVIKIFKFEPKKNFRRAELNSVSSLGGTAKGNNLEYVPFSGEKYGTSSYLVKLSVAKPGEYGIIVLNPNNLDQKQTVVSSFAITE